jgi:opacity protein-like surface antigen
MNMKKMLFSSVLALALLVTAAPAFASEGNVSSATSSSTAGITSNVTVQKIETRYIYRSVNQFASSFVEGGVTWYLKGVTYEHNQYVARYEGHVS